MSAVILSDEEIEAQRRDRLAVKTLTQVERDAINGEFAGTALERESARQEQQAHYDTHQGAQ